MLSATSLKFHSIWNNATKEIPPNPTGAVGELMSMLGGVLEVDIVEYGQVESSAFFLLDLSSLGFKGMDVNVVMVTHPSANEEQSELHARLLAEYKETVKSIGFCFHISLQYDEPEHNPFVPSWLEIVCMCGRDLERLLTAQVPSAVMFEVIRRQVGLPQLNPFNTTREARGAMFKGRSSEVQSLVGDLDNHYLVTGARRIGKTSLLKKAHSVLQGRTDTRHRSFYFNCLSWGDYSDCAHRLALKVDPRRDLRVNLGLRNLAYLLQRASADGRRPSILFLDECDRLLDSARAGNWQFLRLLHEATTSNWIRITFAGFRSVQELSTSRDSPFFRSIKDMPTPPLSAGEARGLLSDPFNSMDIPLRDPEQILDRVQKGSAGHPFLVQFYGEQLFARAAARTPQEVRLEDIDEIEDGFDLANFLKSHFLWNTLESDVPSRSERLCAVVCALQGDSQGWTERDFLDACAAHSSAKLSLDEAQRALTNLYYSCILGFSKGRYSFTFPLLRDTIARLYPSVETLLNDLERT